MYIPVYLFVDGITLSLDCEFFEDKVIHVNIHKIST